MPQNALAPPSVNVLRQAVGAGDYATTPTTPLQTFSPRPGVTFVGQVHGQPMTLPSRIRSDAAQYGAYYEGTGGDKLPGVSYKGSWDDAASKAVKG